MKLTARKIKVASALAMVLGVVVSMFAVADNRMGAAQVWMVIGGLGFFGFIVGRFME